MRRQSILQLLLVLLAVGLLGTTAAGLPTAATQPATVLAQEGSNTTFVTYNGEVAVEDLSVRAEGRAPGAGQLVYVLIDASGATVAMSGGTDADRQFSRNIPLEGENRRLTPGTVEGFVITPGRDGVYGASGESPESTRDLVQFASELGREGLTQPQAVQRLLQVTTQASGSDDRMIRQSFRLAQGNTQVTDLVPAGRNESGIQPVEPGETVTVRGVTNRRPDQASVIVSVSRGPSAGDVRAAIIEQWGTSGVWSGNLTFPETMTPGNYTLRVDDGDQATTTQFSVVERRQQPTESPAPTATATATTAETTMTTDRTGTPTETAAGTDTGTEMPGENPGETATNTPTAGGGPGFGFAVAVLGIVIAVAITVVGARRRGSE